MEVYSYTRQPLVHIHIADIHFGSIDPYKELQILNEQFFAKIANIQFDLLSIDGDLFDRRLPANSEAVACAINFVNECVSICINKGAGLFMISGTGSHESGQLSLFKDMADRSNDMIRIFEHMQFTYFKGYKILIIPEEYNKPAAYYEKYLCETYDMCFMHGSIVGGLYGANKEKLQSNREPIFSIDSFSCCRGPIISGHVHKAMCLNSYMYYVSNPIRYHFGEEEEKGFAICCSNDTGGHYYHFIPITSFRYETISIESLGTNDPNRIVSTLTNMQAQGIDYIRLDMSTVDPQYTAGIMNILEKQYAQSQTVFLIKPKDGPSIVTDPSEEVLEKYADLDFLLDNKLSEMDKFVMYINKSKGCEFITTERLKQVLEGSL